MSPMCATSAWPPASPSSLPGEPAKRPYEAAMAHVRQGLLRALRRRHDPAGAAVHQHAEEIDRLVSALAETFERTLIRQDDRP
jgi:hypothetical protein